MASFCVIAAMGVVGGALSLAVWFSLAVSRQGGRPRLLHLASAFTVGAFASEAYGFARYYIAIGNRDPELLLGLIGATLELGAVTLVGAAASCIGAFLGRLLWNLT